MTDPRVRRQLRNVHRLLSAGRNGYETAASEVHSPEVRGLLFSLSSGRVLMINELERELERLKAVRPLQRSFRLREAVQRRWMAVCSVLQAPSEAAILQECGKGEWFLVQQLRALMDAPGLRTSTRTLLAGMEQEVSRSLDDILLLQSGLGLV